MPVNVYILCLNENGLKGRLSSESFRLARLSPAGDGRSQPASMQVKGGALAPRAAIHPDRKKAIFLRIRHFSHRNLLRRVFLASSRSVSLTVRGLHKQK